MKKVIDTFVLTWDQIEEKRGIAQVNKELKEKYGSDVMIVLDKYWR